MAEQKSTLQKKEPAPAAEFVSMLKFDAAQGKAEKIEVHPSCVRAHMAAGWAVLKEG